MIATYSEYIDRYVQPQRLNGKKVPGEHHFVSVYLVPRMHCLTGLVPDYVNPDGTKGINGDVVYFKNGSHNLGIEVKLGTIRLTKYEFNSWIVRDDERLWPNVFLGIGSSGVVVLRWREFREAYLAAVRIKSSAWSPREITEGYGPMKSVNVLFPKTEQPGYFRTHSDPKQAETLESNFLDALACAIGC